MMQAISATGMKGFLQWLQQDQPAVYAATGGGSRKRRRADFPASTVRCCVTSAWPRVGAAWPCAATGPWGVVPPPAGVVPWQPLQPARLRWPRTWVASTRPVRPIPGPRARAQLTGVANIISAVSGAALSASDGELQQPGLDPAMTRAQQGLSPLTLSSTTAGIPTMPRGSPPAPAPWCCWVVRHCCCICCSVANMTASGAKSLLLLGVVQGIGLYYVYKAVSGATDLRQHCGQCGNVCRFQWHCEFDHQLDNVLCDHDHSRNQCSGSEWQPGGVERITARS